MSMCVWNLGAAGKRKLGLESCKSLPEWNMSSGECVGRAGWGKEAIVAPAEVWRLHSPRHGRTPTKLLSPEPSHWLPTWPNLCFCPWDLDVKPSIQECKCLISPGGSLVLRMLLESFGIIFVIAFFDLNLNTALLSQGDYSPGWKILRLL